MKPRPFHHRIIASIIAICALILSHTALAAEFWGHRYSKQVDIRYGEQPGQVFDLYMYGQRTGEPSYFATDPTPRPTLVWIHGGGWVAGDKARETPWLIPYLQRGWNVANVNYRQGPNTAPNAADVERSMFTAASRRENIAGDVTAWNRDGRVSTPQAASTEPHRDRAARSRAIVRN